MARTYAICSHNRVVLAGLGILYLVCLMSVIVRDYTFFFHTISDISQARMILNSCDMSSSTLKLYILYVFQDMILDSN